MPSAGGSWDTFCEEAEFFEQRIQGAKLESRTWGKNVPGQADRAGQPVQCP